MSGLKGIRCIEQSFAELEGTPAQVGVEAHVSARKCKTVRLPNRRQAGNTGWKREVPSHRGHDGKLLSVLPPEVGVVRAHPRKQLRHDRRHPGKVAGSMRTFHSLSNAPDRDGRSLLGRIHVGHVWGEYHICTCCLAQQSIPVEISWVLVKIRILVELQRVYEDTHNNCLVLALRRFDETEMSLM